MCLACGQTAARERTGTDALSSRARQRRRSRRPIMDTHPWKVSIEVKAFERRVQRFTKRVPKNSWKDRGAYWGAMPRVHPRDLTLAPSPSSTTVGTQSAA